MRQRQTKAEALADRRIDEIYRRHCSGIQIDILDIGKIFDAGRKAIAAGCDDEGLRVAIVAFVETIRQ